MDLSYLDMYEYIPCFYLSIFLSVFIHKFINHLSIYMYSHPFIILAIFALFMMKSRTL